MGYNELSAKVSLSPLINRRKSFAFHHKSGPCRGVKACTPQWPWELCRESINFWLGLPYWTNQRLEVRLRTIFSERWKWVCVGWTLQTRGKKEMLLNHWWQLKVNNTRGSKICNERNSWSWKSRDPTKVMIPKVRHAPHREGLGKIWWGPIFF